MLKRGDVFVLHEQLSDIRYRTLTDYYSRYRPGFRGVVVSLVIFSCFVHYFVLYMMYKLSLMRIKQ